MRKTLITEALTQAPAADVWRILIDFASCPQLQVLCSRLPDGQTNGLLVNLFALSFENDTLARFKQTNEALKLRAERVDLIPA
ncbi:MAG: hypothetical protein Q4A84_00835 [Neisseria sp.]|uniref:hypothetical protein n=1 Tax=Neisseria sp. TaxID=192066 RepID=UPI0026DC54A6|nr:hypothetical protein [Neisseria sp.]MDO4640239.1 hypothetical protein [Neisseria sp.]